MIRPFIPQVSPAPRKVLRSMVDHVHFERLKSKYGYWASWAIWAEEGDLPKNNVGSLDVFEKPDCLRQLNPHVVFVGLNISRGSIRAPLANFHDIRPEATDFKIRYALKDSPWWGGYMTDIIKDFDEKSSGAVVRYLREHKSFEEENAEIFRGELDDLGTTDPLIIAFGRDAHSVLLRQFGDRYRIARIPHYAVFSSKESYRKELSRVW